MRVCRILYGENGENLLYQQTALVVEWRYEKSNVSVIRRI